MLSRGRKGKWATPAHGRVCVRRFWRQPSLPGLTSFARGFISVAFQAPVAVRALSWSPLRAMEIKPRAKVLLSPGNGGSCTSRPPVRPDYPVWYNVRMELPILNARPATVAYWNCPAKNCWPGSTRTASRPCAPQLRRWIVAGRATSFEQMTDLPRGLRERAGRRVRPAGHTVARHLASSDGTHKLLLRLHDDQLIECVLIPENGPAHRLHQHAGRLRHGLRLLRQRHGRRRPQPDAGRNPRTDCCTPATCCRPTNG